jgi:hypothetical protein
MLRDRAIAAEKRRIEAEQRLRDAEMARAGPFANRSAVSHADVCSNVITFPTLPLRAVPITGIMTMRSALLEARNAALACFVVRAHAHARVPESHLERPVTHTHTHTHARTHAHTHTHTHTHARTHAHTHARTHTRTHTHTHAHTHTRARASITLLCRWQSSPSEQPSRIAHTIARVCLVSHPASTASRSGGHTKHQHLAWIPRTARSRQGAVKGSSAGQDQHKDRRRPLRSV